MSRVGETPQSGWSLSRLARLFLIGMPTLLAVLYFGLIAADRHVSEAQFVVRSGTQPAGAGGFGALLEMSGLGHANEEVYAVQAFLSSRSAVEQLATRVPIREIYARPEADPLARFPSPFFGTSVEELHQYLGWMVKITYSSTSAITTLQVQAFRAEDARTVAEALLELGEHTVNQMNSRIRNDAMRYATDEVQRGEQRMVAAQQAITRFRNAELTIDPASSAVVVTELIARLSADLVQAEAQIREVSAASSTSPQLAALRRRADALQGQIARERARVSGGADGIAEKLAVYERLVLEREFAKAGLAAAARSLEIAQQDARRQQLYLERIVEPIAPDKAMAPERVRLVAGTVGVNIILAVVGWLILTGLREHATHHE